MEKVGVFGLGRVGLPLALSFAEENYKVIGIDVDKKRLEDLEKKIMPFIEEGAESLLRKHINKNFKVTADAKSVVKDLDYLVLTLGTPIDANFNPDFSQIENVLERCTPELRKEQTIILRSTLAPGTTEYVARSLEKTTPFKIGKDIYLAYCPERIAEGKAIKEIRELPQIIGTLDDKSMLKASRLFSKLTEESLTTDAKSAELAKLFSNMYRYVNFAIANEFMMIAQDHERDIHEITRLVNENYKRQGLKTPGFAAGPCLYKDGFFLVSSTPFPELITTAWKINESTPAYLIEKIKKERDLTKEKVAILGLTFKKDVDDKRNSLSYKAKKIFLAEGAEVATHDPYVKPGNLESVLDNSGIVFVAMNHAFYENKSLDYLRQHVKEDCLVADIWNNFNTGKILFNLDKD